LLRRTLVRFDVGSTIKCFHKSYTLLKLLSIISAFSFNHKISIVMKNENFAKSLKLFVLLISLISFSITRAQEDKDFKKKIPPFHIQLVNGDSLASRQLKKNVPSMVVYFDPTCEHCQAFTRSLLEKINSFNNIQIVYITYTPISEVQKFEKDFNLKKYSNFKLGTEGDNFIVQKFYYVSKFPFIALYDKKGMLITFYRDPPSIETLVQQFEAKS
jgi:thiol-disulfide isomerase/thioredoxin